jgi:hypothetical protein
MKKEVGTFNLLCYAKYFIHKCTCFGQDELQVSALVLPLPLLLTFPGLLCRCDFEICKHPVRAIAGPQTDQASFPVR